MSGTDRIEEIKQASQQEKWLCEACRFLLAYVEGRKIIRIKRKDLYVEIEIGKEGRVSLPCPRCGKPNTIKDDGE